MGDLNDIIKKWRASGLLDGLHGISTDWVHASILQQPIKEPEKRKQLFGIHKSGKNNTWGKNVVLAEPGVYTTEVRINPETGEIMNVRYPHVNPESFEIGYSG